LAGEFSALGPMGLSHQEITRIAEGGFLGAFLAAGEKSTLLQAFRAKAAALSLI
jgi:hypothetical protein